MLFRSLRAGFPGGAALHDSEPSDDHLPAVHTLQVASESAPVALLNRPAAHAVQLFEPGADWKRPTGHEVCAHEPSDATLWPAEAATHLSIESPCTASALFTTHFETVANHSQLLSLLHAVAPRLVHSAPNLPRNLPEGQSAHTLAPATDHLPHPQT